MKKIILLTLLLITLQAFSQQPDIDVKKFKENRSKAYVLPLDLSKKYRIISKDSLDRILKAVEQKQYSPGFGDLSFTYPNGNKLYLLKQDNMPCIVPDQSRYNMPNAGRSIKITGMPPGSKPIIPKEK